MIRDGTKATFLTGRICTFDRINMLYGNKNGDRILAQFAEILKRLLGTDGHVSARREPSSFFACRARMRRRLRSSIKLCRTPRRRFATTRSMRWKAPNISAVASLCSTTIPRNTGRRKMCGCRPHISKRARRAIIAKSAGKTAKLDLSDFSEKEETKTEPPKMFGGSVLL